MPRHKRTSHIESDPVIQSNVHRVVASVKAHTPKTLTRLDIARNNCDSAKKVYHYLKAKKCRIAEQEPSRTQHSQQSYKLKAEIHKAELYSLQLHIDAAQKRYFEALVAVNILENQKSAGRKRVIDDIDIAEIVGTCICNYEQATGEAYTYEYQPLETSDPHLRLQSAKFDKFRMQHDFKVATRLYDKYEQKILSSPPEKITHYDNELLLAYRLLLCSAKKINLRAAEYEVMQAQQEVDSLQDSVQSTTLGLKV